MLRDRAFRIALVGAVLVAPAVYFFGSAFLKYELGIGLFFAPFDALHESPTGWWIFNTLVSPVVILGGPVLALMLNLLQVVRLAGHTEPEGLTASVTLLRKPWNLAVAGAGMVTLFVLVSYLVLENWRCWVGLMERC